MPNQPSKPKRVSQYYKLGRGQESLEFVDVNVRNDTRLFLDPGAIRLLETEFSSRCSSLIQSFFGYILECIRTGKEKEAKDLLASLSEPNETRLGYTKGRAKGHGVGRGLAGDLYSSIANSKAVQTGLLQDLEEAALFIDGINKDVISDIVTNIIRGALLDFTAEMCAKYKIPTKPGIVFRVWNSAKKGWEEQIASVPVVDSRPLILIPRSFVRRLHNVFAPDRYYTHYILPYLQNQHVNANSSLVEVLADGSTKEPTKKALREIHTDVKDTNITITQQDPSRLGAYMDDAEKEFEAISHEDLATSEGAKGPNFEKLLADVLTVPAGDKHATAYHLSVEKLLTALFYPSLDDPKIEYNLHEGRKRIDINYTNIARHGFFYWVHDTHKIKATFIPVEAKNYDKTQVNNKELDQLTGRFGKNRGQLGFLCYRSVKDKKTLLQRQRDAVSDGRGYVIALDDEDLKELVRERQLVIEGTSEFQSLRNKLQALT